MTQNALNNSASEFTVDNLFLDANTISTLDTNGNLIIAPDGTGSISVTDPADLLCSGDRAQDIGSTTNAWDNIYCDGISFDDGANTLDDYEEGTFTAGIAFGGGTTGITYGQQDGWYVKIGNVVFHSIVVVLTNKGSSTGIAKMTGLPYTTVDGANDTNVVSANTLTLTAGYTVPSGGISAATTVISLWQTTPATGSNLIDYTNTNFSNTTNIYASGNFQTS